MFDELNDLLGNWTDRDPELKGAGRVWLAALSAMLEDSLVMGMYPERVTDVIDRSFSAHPTVWPVMCLSAAIAQELRDTVRVIRHLNSAVGSPESVAETYLEACRLSMLGGMVDRAMRYVMQGKRKFPTDIRLQYAEATIHIELGEDSRAITVYRDIVATSALQGDAWSQLGWLYDRQGRVDSSDLCYERALEIDPRNPFVCNNYAYSLCLRGIKLETALKLSRTSLDTEPENAAYLDTYAWILYHLGRLSEAESAAKSAITFGGNATHYEHYGHILLAKGEIDAAVKAWETSLRLDPERSHLQDMINRNK